MGRNSVIFSPEWEVATAVAGSDKLSPPEFYGDLAGNNRCVPFLADMLPLIIHNIWDGTAAGVFTYYGCMNHVLGASGTARWVGNGDWEPLNTLISPVIVDPAGAPGTHYITLTKTRPKFMYIGYARSGGSGKAKALVGRTWT